MSAVHGGSGVRRGSVEKSGSRDRLGSRGLVAGGSGTDWGSGQDAGRIPMPERWPSNSFAARTVAGVDPVGFTTDPACRVAVGASPEDGESATGMDFVSEGRGSEGAAWGSGWGNSGSPEFPGLFRSEGVALTLEAAGCGGCGRDPEPTPVGGAESVPVATTGVVTEVHVPNRWLPASRAASKAGASDPVGFTPDPVCRAAGTVLPGTMGSAPGPDIVGKLRWDAGTAPEPTREGDAIGAESAPVAPRGIGPKGLAPPSEDGFPRRKSRWSPAAACGTCSEPSPSPPVPASEPTGIGSAIRSLDCGSGIGIVGTETIWGGMTGTCAGSAVMPAARTGCGTVLRVRSGNGWGRSGRPAWDKGGFATAGDAPDGRGFEARWTVWETDGVGTASDAGDSGMGPTSVREPLEA